MNDLVIYWIFGNRFVMIRICAGVSEWSATLFGLAGLALVAAGNSGIQPHVAGRMANTSQNKASSF